MDARRRKKPSRGPSRRKSAAPARGRPPARSCPAPAGRRASAKRRRASAKRFWTRGLEAAASRVQAQASGFAWMYERKAAVAKRWETFLAIAAGVLAAAIGVQGLVAVNIPGGREGGPLWATVASTVIGYVVAVLVVFRDVWRLDEVRSKCISAQMGFAGLHRSIVLQLALPASRRQEAQEFVASIFKELETLKATSPILDPGTRRAYTRRFRNNPIFDEEDLDWAATRYQSGDSQSTPEGLPPVQEEFLVSAACGSPGPGPPALSPAPPFGPGRAWAPAPRETFAEKILAEYEAAAARATLV